MFMGVPEPAASTSRPRRRHFWQANLAQLSDALEQSLFAERIARQPGLLQGLDARVKLVTTLMLLLAISLSRSLAVLGALYAVTLLLAWSSAVPLAFFVKRVWVFIPIFAGIVAVPALFMIPGPALLRLPLGLTLTSPGLTTALFLVLRVASSVSTVVLLVLCTPWNNVLKALGVLRVPDVLVVVLDMTYRYIFLLLRLAGDMFLSRQSRTLGRLSPADERRQLAAGTGALLSHSLQLSGEVYLAMLSRGLQGYPRVMETFRMRRRDWLYGAAVFAVAAGAVWLGR